MTDDELYAYALLRGWPGSAGATFFEMAVCVAKLNRRFYTQYQVEVQRRTKMYAEYGAKNPFSNRISAVAWARALIQQEAGDQ